MVRSSSKEDASQRPARIRSRARRFGPISVSSVILLTIWAAPVDAAGPLYAVPSEPPSVTESVDFANALNRRVRRLPPSLDPPTSRTPAQVEARLQTLERGVAIKGRANKPNPEKMATKSEVHSANRLETAKGFVAAEPGDRAPLSAAFVAAGILAFLGLILSARGRHSGPRQA
jgi:hypothetical protein